MVHSWLIVGLLQLKCQQEKQLLSNEKDRDFEVDTKHLNDENEQLKERIKALERMLQAAEEQSNQGEEFVTAAIEESRKAEEMLKDQSERASKAEQAFDELNQDSADALSQASLVVIKQVIAKWQQAGLRCAVGSWRRAMELHGQMEIGGQLFKAVFTKWQNIMSAAALGSWRVNTAQGRGQKQLHVKSRKEALRIISWCIGRMLQLAVASATHWWKANLQSQLDHNGRVQAAVDFSTQMMKGWDLETLAKCFTQFHNNYDRHCMRMS